MIQTWKVMLARFPYGGTERTEIVDWAAACARWAAREKRISEFVFWHVNDTPTSMCRNRAVKAAIANQCDVIVMVDSDMEPDIDRKHPFLPSALDFMFKRWAAAPTIISAPYLTGAPSYNPTMGRWRSHHQGNVISADVYTREEAVQFHGIQPCDLQGTGLMAIDLRIFTGFPAGDGEVKLPAPWFYYEYRDPECTEKASTEDMVFTRNATALFAAHGLEIGFVDWDAWSYHIKTERVGRPQDLRTRDLAAMFGLGGDDDTDQKREHQITAAV